MFYFCLTKCSVFAIFVTMRNTQKKQIKQKITRSRKGVFVRSDFENLGGYVQIGRALRELVAEGSLIKLGYGLYAKARINRITGKPMLADERGFYGASTEALQRLKVDWQPSDAFAEYQNGSPQIPVNCEVKICDRFQRKIKTDKFELRMVRS